MASTYSTNLKLELMGTGDQSGTWGDTTNTNLGTLLEQAIVGYETQAITDGADTVLTIANGASSTARNYVLQLTGALTANRNLIVPAIEKSYIIHNATTGGFSVTVKVSGQTGVTVANGKRALVYNNGTDIIEFANAPVTEAGTQTLTNKTLSGATVISDNSSGNALRITQTGTGNALVVEDSANPDSTPFVVDASGNVGIGTTAPTTGLTLLRDGATQFNFVRNSGDTSPPYFVSLKRRGTEASKVIVNNGDQSLAIQAYGYDGSTDRALAEIGAYVDGTPGTNDMPGRLVFSTTADGASSPTERMRIDSSGNVGLGVVPSGIRLDVFGANDTAFSPNVFNVRITGSNSATSGNAGGGISFRGYTTGTTSISDLAFISGIKENTTDTNYAGALVLGTRTNASGAGSFERMRITSAGNVGIGTTSPTDRLTVAGTTPTIRIKDGANTGFYLQQGSGAAYVWNPDNFSLVFGTNNLERFRIGASGQLGIGGETYGTAGQVLTSGGASAAPTWSTINSGKFEYIGSGAASLSSSTSYLTFTNIASYSQILIFAFIRNNDNTGSFNFPVYLSSNNGSSYGAARNILSGITDSRSTSTGTATISNTNVVGNKTISPYIQNDSNVYTTTATETVVTGTINALRFSGSSGTTETFVSVALFGVP